MTIKCAIRALEEIVRVGSWVGSDGYGYCSRECRIARVALRKIRKNPGNFPQNSAADAHPRPDNEPAAKPASERIEEGK